MGWIVRLIRPIARAVVKLARTFNLRTVAEGIEEPEQAAELLAIGADMGQGYLYARPLGAEAMGSLLAQGRVLAGPALAADALRS